MTTLIRIAAVIIALYLLLEVLSRSITIPCAKCGARMRWSEFYGRYRCENERCLHILDNEP